jgi:hypothetical protein
MEGATFAAPAAATPGGVEDKGLKRNAIGFVSSAVIGVASTAPGYSLAASLGFIAAVGGIGLQSPAILLSAFIPMAMIAAAYYYMNRADPDCGTTFAWVTKAMGPWAGWLGGWAIVVADIIVMANLAQIAGKYTFLLFDWDSAANSTAAVTAVGVGWIVVMTTICYIGIELSARTQVVLRDRDPRHLRRGGPGQGRYRGRRRYRGRPVVRMDQSVRDRLVQRPDQRDPHRDLHLSGMGLDGDGQRGDRGFLADARATGDHGDRSAAADLRGGGRRRPGLRWGGAAGQEPG